MERILSLEEQIRKFYFEKHTDKNGFLPCRGNFCDCLETLALLRLIHFFVIPLAFGQKMPIGCPVRRENLGVVRHFPAVPLCTAGHNDLLRPPLWYTCQKIQIDDTVITKTKPSSKAKRPTEGTGWHYSHLEGKIVYGYQVHAAIISTGKTGLCYSLNTVANLRRGGKTAKIQKK